MTEEIKLTQEQAEQIKKQLLAQLTNFPEDKQYQIKEQIKSMSTEEVEQFIKQNQLNHLNPNKCIFCSITEGKTSCVKTDEDSENIAILEINPLTRGHTLIVPKNHQSAPSHNFATKVAENLQQKLNAKDIQVEEKEIMNHKIMNLIPIYKDTDLTTQKRTQTKKQDLEKLQQELTKKQESKQPTEPPQPKKTEPIPKLKPRIP